MLNSNIIIV